MPTVKTQHSIVHPQALLKIIQREYSAIGANQCELLALGCNDNFRIKAKRKDYAFRLYRYQWWPESEIDGELRFLEALYRRGINVCKPIRNNQKQRYVSLKAPEGVRYGALFSFLPGVPLRHSFGKNNVHMYRLGELLSQIHTTADRLKNPIERWTMGFDFIIEKFLERAPTIIGHRKKDLIYMENLARKLEAILLDEADGILDFGLCHGDLHTHNVMLQPDGELAIFDFDWCAYSWRGYDLATVWWSLPRSKEGVTPWRAFLRGYTKHRRLNVKEKDMLPWFVMLRQFELLSFHIANRRHFGTAWQNEHYYDYHFGFLREWEKQHIKK